MFQDVMLKPLLTEESYTLHGKEGTSELNGHNGFFLFFLTIQKSVLFPKLALFYPIIFFNNLL